MVRIHPDPPGSGIRDRRRAGHGAVAQLGERLLCKQEAVGSIPSGSTTIGCRTAFSGALSVGECSDEGCRSLTIGKVRRSRGLMRVSWTKG